MSPCNHTAGCQIFEWDRVFRALQSYWFVGQSTFTSTERQSAAGQQQREEGSSSIDGANLSVSRHRELVQSLIIVTSMQQ
jgi:hypothetical protein